MDITTSPSLFTLLHRILTCSSFIWVCQQSPVDKGDSLPDLDYLIFVVDKNKAFMSFKISLYYMMLKIP